MSASNDKPPADSEAEAAAKLAERVDDLLRGEHLPGVMPAEEREDAEMSAMIHAAFHPPSLDAERTASLIDSALLQGAGVEEAPAVNDLDAARERRRSRLPFAIASVVAMAAIALFFWRTAEREESLKAPSVAVMELSTSETSRSSDRDIGPIAKEANAAASQRLDSVYRGRMNGYRSLRYRSLVGTP